MWNLLCLGFVVGDSWHCTGHALPAMSLPPNGSQRSSHHLPPSDCPSSSQQHYVSSPSRRQKVCGACGDRAKSYHFGGISCDSCKAFFRRSVQNEAFKNFHCPYEGRCDITITSRKCCQYCRFKKCLSIGMETGWVMTEEERLALVKNRMERKQRQGAPSDSGPHPQDSSKKSYRIPSVAEYEPDINDMPKYLAPEDMGVIESLVNAYEASYNEVPFSENLQKTAPPTGRTRTEILDMFFTVVKQFTNFSQRLETFAKIPQHDQEILLRTGVLELCFIRGAFIYDEKLARWPHTGKPMYRDSPTLDSDDIKKLVSPELFTKHMDFIRSVKDLYPDEATTMLLLVIVLLSPDRPGLENESLVAEEQEKFYILMKKYMSWRYGEEYRLALYPKLLLRLPDLRELNDYHTDYNLRLGTEEVLQVQQKLSSLKIDSCFQRSEPIVTSSVQPTRVLSAPGASVRSSAEVGPRVPWSLIRDVLRVPTSPYSQEEESSSSESSDRLASFRC